MKYREILAVLMTMMVGTSILSGCGGEASSESSSSSVSDETSDTQSASTESEGSSEGEGTDYGGITLTVMNSKPELESALEEVTAEWGEKHGVEFEVYQTDSPGDTLAQRYAAGDPPVLAIVDPNNVKEMGEEDFLDLSDQEWMKDGGEAMGVKIGDAVYGFPFCVESAGMIYNKTALEDITGEEFDPDAYKTPEEFQNLLDQLVADEPFFKSY